MVAPMVAFVVESAGATPTSQFAPVFHSPPLTGPTQVALVCAWLEANVVESNAAQRQAVFRSFVVCIIGFWVAGLFRVKSAVASREKNLIPQNPRGDGGRRHPRMKKRVVS